MASADEFDPKPRRATVAVDVGGVIVGGGAPVVVQSMTNTDTEDVIGTAIQVKELAIAGLPGNVAGQWLGRQIPEAVLILGFCALVLWTAWRMWRSSNLPREGSGALRSAPLVAIGLGVGLFSGLMGVGGGFLVVPALLAFTPLSMLAATPERDLPPGLAAQIEMGRVTASAAA